MKPRLSNRKTAALTLMEVLRSFPVISGGSRRAGRSAKRDPRDRRTCEPFEPREARSAESGADRDEGPAGVRWSRKANGCFSTVRRREPRQRRGCVPHLPLFGGQPEFLERSRQICAGGMSGSVRVICAADAVAIAAVANWRVRSRLWAEQCGYLAQGTQRKCPLCDAMGTSDTPKLQAWA